MNEQQQNLLNKFLRAIESDKNVYIDIMSRSDDSSKLLQWVVNNDINPYGIFPHWCASCLSELQSFVMLHSMICYYKNHGEFNYVNITKNGYDQGPRITFRCRSEPNFYEEIKKDFELKDSDPFDGEEYSYEFEIIQSLDEFIRIYNEHEEYHLKLYEEHQKFLNNWK